jgi:hypothetical protein
MWTRNQITRLDPSISTLCSLGPRKSARQLDPIDLIPTPRTVTHLDEPIQPIQHDHGNNHMWCNPDVVCPEAAEESDQGMGMSVRRPDRVRVIKELGKTHTKPSSAWTLRKQSMTPIIENNNISAVFDDHVQSLTRRPSLACWKQTRPRPTFRLATLIVRTHPCTSQPP